MHVFLLAKYETRAHILKQLFSNNFRCPDMQCQPDALRTFALLHVRQVPSYALLISHQQEWAAVKELKLKLSQFRKPTGWYISVLWQPKVSSLAATPRILKLGLDGGCVICCGRRCRLRASWPAERWAFEFLGQPHEMRVVLESSLFQSGC